MDEEVEERRPRLQRPSAPRSEGEQFDEKAVLEQDRALIEQLTTRSARDRPKLKRPKTPPKVTPYRPLSSGDTAPPSPAAVLERTTPEVPYHSAVIEAVDACAEATPGGPCTDTADFSAVAATCAEDVQLFEPSPGPPAASATKPEPVVPRMGGLFTASDIDSLMNRFSSDGAPAAASRERPSPERAPKSEHVTHSSEDISKEFYSSLGMEMPRRKPPPPPARSAEEDVQMPDRSALRERIRAIDSWLEDDIHAREKLDEGTSMTIRPTAPEMTLQEAMASSRTAPAAREAELFGKLEAAKKRHKAGEVVPAAEMKDVASRLKPLLPNFSLEQLVRTMGLFCSVRYEDHDFYLHILGEIPVQVRGSSPQLLTKCLRILGKLRLNEETYLELFSMEVMNLIRAARPAGRAPRRPPTRIVAADAADVKAPPPPSKPRTPAPFTARMLIQIGNSLTQLSSKHAPRFMDAYQEQLALAIPTFSQEECELVTPALALSPLMPDTLRRAFLERCAEVNAGASLPDPGATVAPDIERYQKDAAELRRRQKSYLNIFFLEASLRKETFAFFTSLPAEVRSYLERLHDVASQLPRPEPGRLASQVAAVLDQLGVRCDLHRRAGPLPLHVVAQTSNPRAEVEEIVYECCEADCYCALRQDDKSAAPQPTTSTKLRHKLLSRLGVQLIQINIWEWNRLSEAQRINYMVKLQSL